MVHRFTIALLECPPPWNSMVPKASVGLSCVCLLIDHFSERLSFFGNRSDLSFWLEMLGGRPTCCPIKRPQQHLQAWRLYRYWMSIHGDISWTSLCGSAPQYALRLSDLNISALKHLKSQQRNLNTSLPLTYLWGSLALTMIWTHSLLLKALSIQDFCAWTENEKRWREKKDKHWDWTQRVDHTTTSPVVHTGNTDKACFSNTSLTPSPYGEHACQDTTAHKHVTASSSSSLLYILTEEHTNIR